MPGNGSGVSKHLCDLNQCHIFTSVTCIPWNVDQVPVKCQVRCTKPPIKLRTSIHRLIRHCKCIVRSQCMLATSAENIVELGLNTRCGMGSIITSQESWVYYAPLLSQFHESWNHETWWLEDHASELYTVHFWLPWVKMFRVKWRQTWKDRNPQQNEAPSLGSRGR